MIEEISGKNTSSESIITNSQKDLMAEIGNKIEYAQTLLKVSESADELGYLDITKDDKNNLFHMLCNVFDEIALGYKKLQVELKIK